MTPPPGGYFGRALVVDVGDGAAEVLALDEAVLRRYIGGVGLGAWLLHRVAPPRRRSARARGAAGVRLLSPLVGTPLTTSAKFAVVAKSPLTDRLNDALSSSHFALAGKRTGFDALVVAGRVRSAVGAASSTTTASGSSRPPSCGACPPPRPRRGCGERLGPGFRRR